LKVLFYGRLAETIASELDLPGRCSVAELRDRLIDDHPAAEATLRSSRSRACVGDTLVADDFAIGEDAIVEFLPPVSGG
jgi:molybdopterin converting factor small subunit